MHDLRDHFVLAPLASTWAAIRQKWQEYYALDDCVKLRFLDKVFSSVEIIKLGHQDIRVYIVALVMINITP